MVESYRYKTTPLPHQMDCYKLQFKKRNFAFLADMGTGKTKMAIDTGAFMYDNGLVDAWIILGNCGSYRNWVGEIEKHLPDHIQYSLGIWSSKNTKKQTAVMDKATHSVGPELKILLMNTEALAYERSLEYAKDFTRRYTTLAIADESTLLSNPKAARTEGAFEIRDLAAARRILTGSCIDNSPMDAWSQFEFLEKGALGFTSYYAFRAMFATLEDTYVYQRGERRAVKIITGFRNLDLLKERIQRLSFIIKKEDCLKLPDKTTSMWDVSMSKEQKKAYDELVEEFMTTVLEEEPEDAGYGFVGARSVLKRLIRLRQVLCGFVKDDMGNVIPLPSNRLDSLMDILKETSGKVLIWTVFTYDIKNISERIKKEYGEKSVMTFFGETSNNEREAARRAFERGRDVSDARFLVLNCKTGGFGNNFTAATTSIYYSYDFDNNIHNQTRDRNYRIGQTDPVSYIYMRVPETVDDKTLGVLSGKTKLSEYLTASNWLSLFK